MKENNMIRGVGVKGEGRAERKKDLLERGNR
jgi:hypothetical protein